MAAADLGEAHVRVRATLDDRTEADIRRIVREEIAAAAARDAAARTDDAAPDGYAD